MDSSESVRVGEVGGVEASNIELMAVGLINSKSSCKNIQPLPPIAMNPPLTRPLYPVPILDCKRYSYIL